MRNLTLGFVLAGLVFSAAILPAPCGVRTATAAEAGGRMLAHDVFFTLNDHSKEAVAKLTADCKKYLSGHPGTVWFAAGPLVAENKRDVNDREFDVGLHVVFVNKAAHDQYQTAERHLKFIAENKANWKKVRVFDSWVEVSAHGSVEGMPGGPKTSKPVPGNEF